MSKADEILNKVMNYGLSQGHEGAFLEPWDLTTLDEAKQQLADGLVAALPNRRLYGIRTEYSQLEIQHFNEAIDQAEAAIGEYFK